MAELFDALCQKHTADYNTSRVAIAMGLDTFCSVNELGQLMHTLCMSHKKAGYDAVAKEQGRRIAQYRKDCGDWRQKDLALATGWTDKKPDRAQPSALSPSRIANYEQGTRRVDIEAARILERISGRSAAYWLTVIDAYEAEVITTLRRRVG